jgi:aspartate oxidase
MINDAGINHVRAIMSRHVGVTRDGDGLQAALALLALGARAALRGDPAPLAPASMVADMALVGSMIALSALQRLESRGAQYRSDFPHPDAGWQHSIDVTLDDVRSRLHELNPRRAHGFTGAAAAL